MVTSGIALKIEEIKEPEVLFSSLETSPPAIQLNSSSTPKTFNIEDLDADAEQEEENEEGEITLKEAQETIMRHTLPKAVSRKMFNSQDMCLKEDCLEPSPLEEKASPRQPIDIQR